MSKTQSKLNEGIARFLKVFTYEMTKKYLTSIWGVAKQDRTALKVPKHIYFDEVEVCDMHSGDKSGGFGGAGSFFDPMDQTLEPKFLRKYLI